MHLADPDLLRTEGFLNGCWCQAADGSRMEAVNAASREAFAEAPRMGPADATRAIYAAATALPSWKRLVAHER